MNEILSQVFSAGTFTQMLRSATPVALAAMGGSMTEHAGIMNIGMDGMILMGALIGVLGSYVIGSAAGGVAVAVLFGILVGLFFALFVVKLKSDEFIIGCALNIFASGFTAYVSRAVFGLSGTSGYEIDYMRPIEIPVIKDIPFLGEIISGNTALVYVAWVLILVMWLFVYKTPYGFWMRASGEKPETLRTAGISPEKMKWLSSVLCGILCGLSGAYLSLGYLNGTFVEGMSASRGFIAFACVIFAAATPAKAYLAALMFGFFDAIGLRLQNYISSDLTSAIPYAITVIMMVYVVTSKERKRRAMQPKHEPAAPPPAAGAEG